MKNPTSKDELLQRLQETDSDLAKKALCRIFSHFSNPAFGALPKRELEIVMFQALQDMKIFDETPDLYSLLSSLRIT